MSTNDPTQGVDGNSEVPADDTGTPSNPPSALELDHKEKSRLHAKTHPAFVANHGRWGKTGNPRPAGKPKSLPRFRKACRDDAFTVKAEIMKRIKEDVYGEIPLGELVRAFMELSDRGGFLKSKEEGELETSKAKLVLTAMAFPDLTPEQRNLLLQAIDGS